MLEHQRKILLQEHKMKLGVDLKSHDGKLIWLLSIERIAELEQHFLLHLANFRKYSRGDVSDTLNSGVDNKDMTTADERD